MTCVTSSFPGAFRHVACNYPWRETKHWRHPKNLSDHKQFKLRSHSLPPSLPVPPNEPAASATDLTSLTLPALFLALSQEQTLGHSPPGEVDATSWESCVSASEGRSVDSDSAGVGRGVAKITLQPAEAPSTLRRCRAGHFPERAWPTHAGRHGASLFS